MPCYQVESGKSCSSISEHLRCPSPCPLDWLRSAGLGLSPRLFAASGVHLSYWCLRQGQPSVLVSWSGLLDITGSCEPRRNGHRAGHARPLALGIASGSPQQRRCVSVPGPADARRSPSLTASLGQFNQIEKLVKRRLLALHHVCQLHPRAGFADERLGLLNVDAVLAQLHR